MIILTLAGRELRQLEIVKYTPKYEPLDSEATGRSRAAGWELMRFPDGLICNFAIEIFAPRSDNRDFIFLMDRFIEISMSGHVGFVPVIHRDMLNRIWNQQMYFTVDGVDCEKFENNFVYMDNVKVNFIARRGRVR